MFRQFCLIILCAVLTGALAMSASGQTLHRDTAATVSVLCGTELTLTAVPDTDYHFDRWSDDNTDNPRTVVLNGISDDGKTIYEDGHVFTYIAYFAANCADYANWPVVALYDWLVMLDVNTIQNKKGYLFSESDVTWFKAVGEVDSAYALVKDDIPVGTGYYLTLDRNFQGTGNYYAEVNIAATSTGMLCQDVMRSVVVHYISTDMPKQEVALMPNLVLPTQPMRLMGLNPNTETTITVYSPTGQLISVNTSTGEETYRMTAARRAGCYMVYVHSEEGDDTLRYIVVNQ